MTSHRSKFGNSSLLIMCLDLMLSPSTHLNTTQYFRGLQRLSQVAITAIWVYPHTWLFKVQVCPCDFAPPWLASRKVCKQQARKQRQTHGEESQGETATAEPSILTIDHAHPPGSFDDAQQLWLGQKFFPPRVPGAKEEYFLHLPQHALFSMLDLKVQSALLRSDSTFCSNKSWQSVGLCSNCRGSFHLLPSSWGGMAGPKASQGS